MIGCSKVEIFETSLDSINEDTFIVNCSNEVNRNKTGALEDIGYLCNVEITEQTRIFNDENKEISINDFNEGDRIQITLAKPIDINEKNRTFKAKEIVKLQ